VAAMVRQHRADGLSMPGHDVAEPAKPWAMARSSSGSRERRCFERHVNFAVRKGAMVLMAPPM
jgi:hypothetical protein